MRSGARTCDDPAVHARPRGGRGACGTIGILDRGELLALKPADDLKQRYEAATLEAAFFAATGRCSRRRPTKRTWNGRCWHESPGRDDARRFVGAAGVVERNSYLAKRYILWDVAFLVWTVANTLTIVFIAKGIEATGGQLDVDQATTSLLIGAVVWAYLGIIFEFLTETVAWERWEGTIEYTFMAPLSRSMHLAGRASSRSSTGSSARCCCSSWSRSSSTCVPDANFAAASSCSSFRRSRSSASG